MSIFRTYFDKNNTILSGSQNEYNTGRNPATQVFYGTNVSRFLLYADFNELQAMITSKTVSTSRITKHTLKMKNAMNDEVLPFRDYRNQVQFSDDTRASSFDLELVAVPEYWDEGIGYDFDSISFSAGENSYVKGYSNWKYRVQDTLWTIEGAIPTGSTVIATQHFDKGNEDLEMDITDFVNGVLSGTTTNYGLCLKFSTSNEAITSDFNKYIVGFFSRHTNTFFEPFIETDYNDLVKDDRKNFILDRENNLVLYVKERGALINLDELPTCTVDNTSFTVVQLSKGIYNATITLPSSSYTDLIMYHDVWSNIIIGGSTKDDISLNIVPKPSSEQYNISENIDTVMRYGLSTSGIKRDEKINQGERKRITVDAKKPFTVYDIDVIDGIYYKVYVKQGVNQVLVNDWTELNRAYDSNYFVLDTSWLVPQQYFVDIKVEVGEELNIYNEELKFTIISQM